MLGYMKYLLKKQVEGPELQGPAPFSIFYHIGGGVIRDGNTDIQTYGQTEKMKTEDPLNSDTDESPERVGKCV